eukprot:m.95807 g.95807  ORF g.95807 m.95807 type:complete len:193 (-) comp13517_c0_seq4:63-641(-)
MISVAALCMRVSQCGVRCMTRKYSRQFPTKPISAVSSVILDTPPQLWNNHTPRVLLIQRGKAPKIGSWTIPGGRIELGETSLAAASRELHEECGLEYGDHVHYYQKPITTTDVIYRSNNEAVEFHYVIVQYFGWIKNSEISAAIRAGDDAQQAAWFELEEMKTVPTSDNLIETVEHIINVGTFLTREEGEIS